MLISQLFCVADDSSKLQKAVRGSVLGGRLIGNKLKPCPLTIAKWYSSEGRPKNFEAVIFEMGGVLLPSPLRMFKGKAKKKKPCILDFMD